MIRFEDAPVPPAKPGAKAPRTPRDEAAGTEPAKAGAEAGAALDLGDAPSKSRPPRKATQRRAKKG